MGLPKVTKQVGDRCSSVTDPAFIQEELVNQGWEVSRAEDRNGQGQWSTGASSCGNDSGKESHLPKACCDDLQFNDKAEPPKEGERSTQGVYPTQPWIRVIQKKNTLAPQTVLLLFFLSGEEPGEADFSNWNPPKLSMADKEAISPAPPAGFCSQEPLAGC